VPKSADGAPQVARVLRVARVSVARARAKAYNALQDLVVTAVAEGAMATLAFLGHPRDPNQDRAGETWLSRVFWRTLLEDTVSTRLRSRRTRSADRLLGDNVPLVWIGERAGRSQ
jgi:hypothetical protein